MLSLDSRLLVARGVFSVLFGILALVWPGPGLFAIALLFAGYAMIDGFLALRSASRSSQKGWLVLEGVVGILAGAIAWVWPGITILALSLVVGVWALVTGVFELMASFSFVELPDRPSAGGRVLLAMAGLASIVLGIFVFGSPAIGAAVLLTYVAVYAIVFGLVLATFGARLGTLRERIDEEREKRAA